MPPSTAERLTRGPSVCALLQCVCIPDIASVISTLHSFPVYTGEWRQLIPRNRCTDAR